MVITQAVKNETKEGKKPAAPPRVANFTAEIKLMNFHKGLKAGSETFMFNCLGQHVVCKVTELLSKGDEKEAP